MVSPSLANATAARQAFSTRVVFFVAGFAVAAWAPLVPFVKARLAIDDAVLGLLLLALGLGSIVTMPLAGALAARLGCRFAITLSTVLLCLALPMLAWVSSLPLLVACLAVFGAGIGGLDVSANIQAIDVERASGRAMMSGFHGFFSLGGVVGAAGVVGLLSIGAAPLAGTLVVSGLSLLALAAAAPHLLGPGVGGPGAVFAFPRGVVWLIGALCFILFLAEGSVLDWSAIFLSSVRGAPTSSAGLGYAAFAATMTLGRLAGDRFVQRVGGVRVVVSGGLCAAAGFALVTLVPSWQAALIGYALVGLGCCNVVPVLFTSVGRQTAMPQAAAVPAITTLGYSGILIGPPAIGFVAHAAGLPAAFLILAVLLLAVAASAPLLQL